MRLHPSELQVLHQKGTEMLPLLPPPWVRWCHRTPLDQPPGIWADQRCGSFPVSVGTGGSRSPQAQPRHWNLSSLLSVAHGQRVPRNASPPIPHQILPSTLMPRAPTMAHARGSRDPSIAIN